MFHLSYPAKFTPDQDGRILVEFPDFPRSGTDGKDMAEAMEEASDCLGSALSFCITEKEEVPRPSPLKRGQRLVPVPLYLAPKVALYIAMREQGINNSQLARKLRVRETVVRRMLNPKHDSKPEKIQAALAALGKSISVAVSDAA